MWRSTLAILCLAAACRYQPPPPETTRPAQLQTRTVWQRTDYAGKKVKEKYVLLPNVLSRCEAGSALGPDGLVSQPSTTFAASAPIYLSMWLAQAPENIQISLRVLDANENEVGVAHRDDAGGARAVTLKVGEALPPGRYKLEGFWGGNLVCERGVEVGRE